MPVAPPLADFLPRTFLFFPARPELSERAAFVAEFERRAAEDAASNVWILKPSDGGKGARILVMAELDPILAHLDGLPFAGKGSVAWVVSETSPRRCCCPGGASLTCARARLSLPTFVRCSRRPSHTDRSASSQIRVWALIDCEYNGWTYDAGVLRTCSSVRPRRPRQRVRAPLEPLHQHALRHVR